MRYRVEGKRSAPPANFPQLGSHQNNPIKDSDLTMKTAIILASLIAAASAFAPQQQTSFSTELNFQYKTAKGALIYQDELGAQVPLGFFDPIGLVNNASPERFDRLRYVEIKHGRVCMLAFLGNVITRAGLHLPGNIDSAGHSFASYPNGLAALFGPDRIPGIGLVQIVLFIGMLELAVMKDLKGTGEFVGDFRNDYIDFGWDSFDEATKLKKRAIELNNGRAAMMGILGLMVHEVIGAPIPLVGAM
jgi:Chlorophyll A-B binding protein